MSQFPGGYQDPYGQAVMPPKKTSGLAIGGLICSLLGVIPCLGWVTAPLGVLLGAIAVATTGATSERKGRGLGFAAVIIGLIMCVVWAWIAMKGYGLIKEYDVFVRTGPQQTLKTGFDGNVSGFQADFDGPGSTAPVAEAQAFLDQLKSRYGAFQSAKIDEQGGPPPQPQPGQTKLSFPYVLTFANQTVNADIELVFADKNAKSLSGMFLKKFGYIIIEDPVNGDLAYPSSAAPSGGSSGRGVPARPGTPAANSSADDAGADAPINTDTPSGDGG